MKISIPDQAYGDYKIRLMRDSDAQAVTDLYRAICAHSHVEMAWHGLLHRRTGTRRRSGRYRLTGLYEAHTVDACRAPGFNCKRDRV